MDHQPSTTGRIYQSLNREREEIRLFQITHDPPPQGPLRVTTRIASLLDRPDYEFLSYCWGSASDKHTILMDEQAVVIPNNLADALSTFRDVSDDDEEIWFWADAICIDQEDTDERNHQVNLMANIISRAAKVRAWLGLPRADVSESLSHQQFKSMVDQCTRNSIFMLELFADTGRLETMLDGWTDCYKSTQLFVDFHFIFTFPFWRRMWIMQELILNANVDVYFTYGRARLSGKSKWRTINNNVTRVFDLMLRARQTFLGRMRAFQPSRYFMHLQEYYNLLQKTTSLKFVQAQLFNLVTIEYTMSEVDSSSSLPPMMIMACQTSDATLKHDHIYAMFSLLPESLVVPIDYTQPYQDAYAAFTFKLMSTTADTSWPIFARSGNPILPSWSIDYSEFSLSVLSKYAAAADVQFGLEEVDKRTIKINGFILDEIVCLSVGLDSPEAYLATLEDWPIFAGQQNALPILIRTLLMDSSMVLIDTLLRDGLTTSRMLDHSGLDTGRRLSEPDLQWWQNVVSSELNALDDISARLLEVLMESISTKRVCRTAKGYIGLVSKTTQIGDKICILGGCHMPLCVRATLKTGVPAYELISECYVDGMMDGQALAMFKEQLEKDGRDGQEMDKITLV